MTSNTAFEHTKETVGSLSFAQAKALQTVLNTRLRHLTVASEVFGITELLEKILSNDFYLRDLFAVMRVSRAFPDTILGSTQLQRRTFTLLREAPAANVPTSTFQRFGNMNPHILDAVSSFGFNIFECHFIGVANPDLYDNLPPLDTVFELGYTISRKVLQEPAARNLKRHYHRRFVKATSGKEHSWERTYINAFAVPVHVGFIIKDEPRRNYGSAQYEFRPEYGSVYYELEPEKATLGALYDLGIKALSELADLLRRSTGSDGG